MATVKLYGNLKRFGSTFDLDVIDTAEAIRALCCQLVGFRQALQQGWYKVRIGKHTFSADTLEKDIVYKVKPTSIIHITPIIKGAKSGGLFGAILGVALIGTAFLLGPVGFALVSSQSAWMIGGMGVSMLLGGISQMLTKMPSMDARFNEQEKKQSTSFSNLSNLIAQGRPVPLAYGEIMTGSLIISQGVETYNVGEEMKKKTEPKKGLFRKG